jgi:IS30 family transposase
VSKPRNMTFDEIALARKLFVEGVPAGQIAYRLGRAESTIDDKLRDLREARRSVSVLKPMGRVAADSERHPSHGYALPAGSPATWGAISTSPWPKRST